MILPVRFCKLSGFDKETMQGIHIALPLTWKGMIMATIATDLEVTHRQHHDTQKIGCICPLIYGVVLQINPQVRKSKPTTS